MIENGICALELPVGEVSHVTSSGQRGQCAVSIILGMRLSYLGCSPVINARYKGNLETPHPLQKSWSLQVARLPSPSWSRSILVHRSSIPPQYVLKKHIDDS